MAQLVHIAAVTFNLLLSRVMFDSEEMSLAWLTTPLSIW